MAKQPPNDDSRAAYESHFLGRYLKVVDVIDDRIIEVMPRAGYPLSIVYRTDGEGRRHVRLLVGPAAKKSADKLK
jgi:hypothetical protein